MTVGLHPHNAKDVHGLVLAYQRVHSSLDLHPFECSSIDVQLQKTQTLIIPDSAIDEIHRAG